MINTWNESDLHAALKKIYALEYNGTTEINIANWICDIVTPDKQVIEIQTANISALKEKTQFLLTHGYRVTIVHPVISEKMIETYSESETLLSKRKSPKQESVYSILRELTGIHPLLLEKNLTLEILSVKVTELRKKTSEPVQLKNKSRRHLKDWIPWKKRLEQIFDKKRFTEKSDYQALIPPSLPACFTIPQLTKAIETDERVNSLSRQNRAKAASQARLLVWLFTRMHILEAGEKQGRSRLYKRT